MANRILSSQMTRSTALRIAARSVLRRPTVRSHSNCVPAAHVPVVSYHDGERTLSDIQCYTTVAPYAHDLKRKAEPLKSEILKGLTPTLKKFTLAGKIAVVTGYATEHIQDHSTSARTNCLCAVVDEVSVST